MTAGFFWIGGDVLLRGCFEMGGKSCHWRRIMSALIRWERFSIALIEIRVVELRVVSSSSGVKAAEIPDDWIKLMHLIKP
jgi:hypothetical protein